MYTFLITLFISIHFKIKIVMPVYYYQNDFFEMLEVLRELLTYTSFMF